MVNAIHAQEDQAAAMRKGDEIIAKLKGMKLSEAAKILQEGLQETLTYMRYPREHWKRIRTNNALGSVRNLSHFDAAISM